MSYLILSLAAASLATAGPIEKRQFFPCKAVSTYTAPIANVTFVDQAIATTRVNETITFPGGATTTTVYTTSYSAVSATCFSSGTTLTPTTLPGFVRRDAVAAPAPTAAPLLERAAPLNLGYVNDGTETIIETFYNPFNPGVCTAIEQEFVPQTTTVSKTITIYSFTTTTAAPITFSLTKKVVQPTPAAYNGVNYYQYYNDYQYPGDGTPNPAKQNSGYGAGGYETADWRGNYSYSTNGLTKTVNFQTVDYMPNPNGNTMCKIGDMTAYSNCAQWTVVFQGFLFARQAGNFTFTITAPTDDELLIWGGDKAYRSYTDTNSDALGLSNGNNEGKPTTTTYTLAAGELFPLTFIAANGGGPARFNTQIAGPYANSSDFLVAPCDASVFVP